MDSIVKAVEENILKHSMIEEGDTVIIGVSGGYDSMMLLDILFRLRDKYGFDIKAAHINHGVRGAEADSDEEYVRRRCEEYGVEFYSKSVDMNGYAKKHKLSAEEAGRKLRYDFFNSIEKEKRYKIAVAHNRNDQAETLLMRMIRGTGADGLAGIQYVSGNVIRPILNISRRDIEDYCSRMELNPRTDSTNLKPIYARNKIRLELIPYIEENYSENIIDSLFRLSDSIKKDISVLKRLAEAEADKVMISCGRNRVEVDNIKLNEVDEDIKPRVIRALIERFKGNLIGIEEAHVENIIALSEQGRTGKSTDITGEIRVRINYDKLYIEKCENTLKVRYNYKIAVNTETDISEINSRIVSALKNVEDVNIDRNNPKTEYFDYDKITGDITVRNRRDGDRVGLFGMKGKKKLKDFFIDMKIDREKREIIPLVLFGDEIAWIAGYRRGSCAPVDRNTRRVLEVRIE